MTDREVLKKIWNLVETNFDELDELNSLSKQYGGVDMTKDKYLNCYSTLGLIESLLEDMDFIFEEE